MKTSDRAPRRTAAGFWIGASAAWLVLCGIGLLLAPAALAQEAPADRLAGKVQNPAIAPSDPDLVAFERLDADALELYVYHRRTGAVSRVQVRKQERQAPRPATPFTSLFEEQELGRYSRYDAQLAWRPRLDAQERQWFIFVSSGGEAGFDLHLSYVDARGRLATEPPIALSLDGLEQFPQWSPDGQRLVFVSGTERGSDLYLVREMASVLARRGVRPEQVERLTSNPAEERFPAWSPDGRYVAFQARTLQDGRENWGISLVEVPPRREVSPPQALPLTAELSAFDEYKPSWAPDGEHLAFYVTQARVGDDSDNLQQDIGVLGIVRAASGRITRGQVLSGFAPRLALNVVPNDERGPSWMPLPDALLLVHVKRDAAAGFPLYATDFARWRSRQPGYEQLLSQAFGTQIHRDPVLAALPDGVRLAFVSQVGGVNRLQVRDRANQPGMPPVALTIPVERSRGTALTRSLLVPGLGQLYKGQTTKGVLLLAVEAAAVGAAVLFATQVDGGELDALEAAYKRSLPDDTACLNDAGRPCENASFRAWRDAYDSARANQTLALAAAGVAVGVWAFNLIDSAGGFPRTIDKPVRVAGARLRLDDAGPHLAYRAGAPHYGLRLRLTF